MLFSQLLTLYITPVVYVYLDAFQRKLAERRSKTAISGTESAETLSKENI